jgi:hypothetical protein
MHAVKCKTSNYSPPCPHRGLERAAKATSKSLLPFFSPAPATCRPIVTLPFGRKNWKSSALRVELETSTWRGAHAPTVPLHRQSEGGETRLMPLPCVTPGGEGEATPLLAMNATVGGCSPARQRQWMRPRSVEQGTPPPLPSTGARRQRCPHASVELLCNRPR